MLKKHIEHLMTAVLFLLLTGNALKAGDLPSIVNPLKGSANQLIKGANNYIDLEENVIMANVATPINRITNIVSFYINEDTTMFLQSNFIAKVKYRIHYKKDAAGTLDSLVNQWLEINYRGVTGDSTYDNRKSFYFYDAAYVKITIDSFYTNVAWNVKPALILMNEMRVNLDYLFQCSSVSAVDNLRKIDTLSQADELYVAWNKPLGADEFDLEWTYIDSLDLNNYKTSGNYNPALIFDNNATRVTIADSLGYKIPLLYDGGGVLFFRVRPVQNKINGKRIEGQWSTTGPNWFFSYGGHQAALNWQASTSFAEGGKRKSVIQYFDGTLRSRQTVTKDNTSGKTVVAETFYDKQGRPSIQVLPAPTLSSIIAYTQNFNRFNTVEYDKSRYDTILGSYCASTADTFSITSGASQYYSPNNPEKNTGVNKFIPDAQRYPFTQTEYTQDNTGRISRQSGVGRDYKIGSNHETKYYYGSASQRELDALFGTEVGNYTHYFKNMVKDANGQYSVSYVDMRGRTIATALAGKLTDSIKMDTLSSHYTATITEKLLDSSSNVTKGLAMEASKELVVTKAGNHTIQYALLNQAFNLTNSQSQTFCFNCLYDLEITISGDCNNQAFNGQVLKITRNNLSFPVDGSCVVPDVNVFDVDTTFYLPEGTYSITKRLTVNRAALEKYRDSVYIPNFTVKTKEQFIHEQLDSMRLQATCEVTCASCTAAVGTWNTFRHNYMIESGYAFSDTASYRNEAWAAYEQELANCNEICGNVGQHTDIRTAMLADMTPPFGQYADTSSNRKIHEVSIFHTGPLNNQPPRYKYFTITYYDENGKKDSVLDKNGNLVPPQQLDIDEYIANFKPSWAKDLLMYHPEYCYLTRYESYASSHLWDTRFRAVGTFREAKDSGFINPIGSSSYPQYNFGNKDPLFDPLTSPAIYDPVSTQTRSARWFMEDSIRYFRPYQVGNSISMWDIASVTTHCKPNESSCVENILNGSHPLDTTVLCNGEADMAWRVFQELYMKEKQELLYKLVSTECPGSHPYEVYGFPVMRKYTLHFISSDIADGLSNYTNLSDTTAARQLVRDSSHAFYVNNCTAYAEQWLLQLSQCPAYDTAHIRSEALPHLINVCVKGSDQWHPYGSSSISPDSSYSFYSFQDVMNWYNTTYGGTPVLNDTARCNVYLITNPPAYGKQSSPAVKPIWNKPDSCDCSRITTLYNTYAASPTGYNSFSDYMFKKHGTVIGNAQLDSLRNLCNGTITCNYLATPILLPTAMQCGVTDVCVTCTGVDTTYNKFKILYPTITPQYEDAQDTVMQKKNKLFANYMNNKLGFSFSHVDYLQFMDNCKGGTRCDTLYNLLNDFKNQFYNKADSVSLDSSGCNVAYWKLDQGGWLHDMRFRMAEYRQNGVFSLPLKDTVFITTPANPAVTLDYVPQPFCIKNGGTGATFELRVRFPFDSSNVNIYRRIRGGTTGQGTTGVFGRLIFSPYFRQANGSLAKIYANINQNFNGLPYQPWIGVQSGSGVWDPVKQPDSAMMQTFHNWTVFKYRIHNDTISLYKDNVLFKRVTYNTANIDFSVFDRMTIQFTGIGYEMDWIKIYDGKDSLIFVDNFDTPCPPDEGYKRKQCSSVCDTAFRDYFNTVRGVNYSLSQIQQLYQDTCGLVFDPCNPVRQQRTLCGKSAPTFPLIDPGDIPSVCADSTELAYTKGTILYEAYRDSIKNSFEDQYLAKCLNAYKLESFTVTRPVSEFHYTLYYYDQAGNLVKTVPPAGVNPVYRQTWLDSVGNFRKNNQKLVPVHALYTTYRYNTLNQVVQQKTPDAGTSSFWYDRLGRLVVSQNAKQFVQTTKEYSYTLYDGIGRITEVGQKPQTTLMTQAISRNQTTLNSWITNVTWPRQQITRTVYDIAVINTGVNANIVQRHLRNRVSYTQYWEVETDPDYDNAVFYTYDIHGNVDTLLNDYGSSSFTQTQNPMNLKGHRWKKMVYRYDLISGKVNHVAYQPGKRDALYHRYGYDAENRLILAETSTDSLYWERDARYEYYRHGPLARAVLGEQKVQGLDYAYTLQGWLKGVNGTVMNPTHDMGGDGLNNQTARDTFGYALYYHGNDYVAINDANRFAGLRAKLVTANAHRPLFNGNISAMAVNIGSLNAPVLYNYTYDQLNRLVRMNMYNGTNTGGANLWSGSFTSTTAYEERISYDANGNILKYFRKGPGGNPVQQWVDSMNYKYYPNTNRLSQVRDSVSAIQYRTTNAAPFNIVDIDNQFVNNYLYDSIGNLIRDSSEAIRLSVGGIKWNVYGKITEINKVDSSTTAFNLGRIQRISYYYDAAGNRIGTKVERYAGRPTYWTWYVRDASGNVMSVYSYTDSLRLTEQHLYGSSRIGIHTPNINLERLEPTPISMPTLAGAGRFSTFTRGNKFFELSNHLGNVLVTLSDKKRGIQQGTTGTVWYYIPFVKSAQDYYPFGMKMPGRTFNAASGYRYGFNGKEEDDEVKGDGNQQDYGMRIYDTRLGRFLSVDPLTKDYPHYTPYSFAGNKPIKFVDLDGAEEHDPMANTKEFIIGVFEGIIGFDLDNVPMMTTCGTEYARLRAEFRAIQLNREIIRNGIQQSGVINWTFDQVGNLVGNLREIIVNGSPRERGRLTGATIGVVTAVAAGVGEFRAMALANRIARVESGVVRSIQTLEYGILTETEAAAFRSIKAPTSSPSTLPVNSTAFEGPGGMARLKYEGASYHGTTDGILKSKAPINGQDALDMSIQIKPTSARRVGIDYENNEFVIFDETGKGSGVYHGHVRSWDKLDNKMKSALQKQGMVDSKGKILVGND